MGILAVLLREENLLFSEEHLHDIHEQTSLMSHRGKRNNFYHDNQIALSCLSDVPLASQPFRFHDDRYTLVYDGTIYNIEELRDELINAGYTFETNMKTEVIAKLFLQQKHRLFERLRGSFAMLIWDKKMNILYGARDRFGIKPLYYMKSDDETIFASEKKSTLFSCYEERIDDYAFHQYLDYKYVPEPYTMTKGIRKVKPGNYFIKKLNEPIKFYRYFHGTFQAKKTKQANAANKISKAINDSVEAHINQTQSNGLLLQNTAYTSILAHFAKQIDPELTAFSVRFGDDMNSMDRIAKLLEIEHVSQKVTATQFIEQLPKIIWLLDDPFADLSIITNYFTAQLAKEHVSAVITAEGANEVLGSLNRNDIRKPPLFSRIQRFTQRIPQFIKKDDSNWHGLGFEDMYKQLFTTREKRQLLKRIITEEPTQQKLFNHVKEENEIIQRQYIDLHSELPSNRLSQIERLSTANGLKLHLPYLDKKLFSVVAQKSDHQVAENIMQTMFSSGQIDQLINDAPTTPVVPIQDWLRNECYFWAEQLIKESETDYLLEKQVVLDMLDRHLHSRDVNVKQLWAVLVFMVWHQVYVEGKYSFRSNVNEEEELVELGM